MEAWIWLVAAFAVCLALLLASYRYTRKLSRLSVSIAAAETKGMKETYDDDYALSHQGGATLALVADGRGTGSVSGALLAEYAVQAFVRLFEPKSLRNIEYYFQSTAKAANQTLLGRVNGGTGGASVAAAVINGKKLYWASCGNSIIAVFRHRELVRLNEGDTVKSIAKQQFYSGQRDRESALFHQRNERLLRYIGMEGFDKMETDCVQLAKGDVAVLMTQGIFGGLYWSELEELLGGTHDLAQIADGIVSKIEGGDMNHENGTILLLKYIG